MILAHLEGSKRVHWEFNPHFTGWLSKGGRLGRGADSVSELESLPFSERLTELFLARGVSREMRLTLLFSISVLSATLGCALAVAQEYVAQSGPPPVRAANPDADPVPLEWVPPALAQLSLLAPIKSNFTLDRTMLGIAAGLVPDTDAPTRQAMHKLDGVSVHTMRFNDAGVLDEAAVAAVRDSYHLRGWKHLVTTSDHGSPVHNGTTDVWVVLDGMNVRGAVVLAETPRSVTLVTVAGNLSPVDMMHLRGHFGIPKLDAGDFKNAPVQ